MIYIYIYFLKWFVFLKVKGVTGQLPLTKPELESAYNQQKSCHLLGPAVFTYASSIFEKIAKQNRSLILNLLNFTIGVGGFIFGLFNFGLAGCWDATERGRHHTMQPKKRRCPFSCLSGSCK